MSDIKYIIGIAVVVAICFGFLWLRFKYRELYPKKKKKRA